MTASREPSQRIDPGDAESSALCGCFRHRRGHEHSMGLCWPVLATLSGLLSSWTTAVRAEAEMRRWDEAIRSHEHHQGGMGMRRRQLGDRGSHLDGSPTCSGERTKHGVSPTPCSAAAPQPSPWRRIGEGRVGARLQPGRGPRTLSGQTCSARMNALAHRGRWGAPPPEVEPLATWDVQGNHPGSTGARLPMTCSRSSMWTPSGVQIGRPGEQ
jgi:hypothetical protein